jgi:hypothetical protein
VALLLKLDDSVQAGAENKWQATCDKSGTVPSGAAPLSSGCGRMLTCSDKIALWNALGVQGTAFYEMIDRRRTYYILLCTESLNTTTHLPWPIPTLHPAGALLSAVSLPIYITSITVGRKFSLPHCCRALCCRVQDFQYVTTSGQAKYRTHHPIMLGTGAGPHASA